MSYDRIDGRTTSDDAEGQQNTEDSQKQDTTICPLCRRTGLKLKQYKFGQKYLIFNKTTLRMERNPDYNDIWVCPTDYGLLIWLRKMTEGRSKPRDILLAAKDFRDNQPIDDSKNHHLTEIQKIVRARALNQIPRNQILEPKKTAQEKMLEKIKKAVASPEDDNDDGEAEYQRQVIKLLERNRKS